MKKFILYIVLICTFFNSLICFANNDISKGKNIIEQEYTIRDFSKKTKETKEDKIIIKTNKPFESVFILPFLVDKLYVGDDIHNDITPLLNMMYPNTNEKTLNFVGDVVKSFVIIKRGYKRILDVLEYNIKAKKMLPKDAPIIAKDGEYIKDDEVLRKTSTAEEYKITNNIRKYLEYDKGTLGEPVRMRDKNYIPSPDVDELSLAILNFDIRGIKEAIEKMPKYNDGSAEKPYIGPHDLRARILLDTSKPGDKERIFGVVDIKVPDGYYINGDVLNKNTKVTFKLREIDDEDLNIKEYQIFTPLSNGFEKDGISRRILVNRVLLPFLIHRKDVSKKTLINGDLFFELCKVNGECETVKTEHSLTLKDTVDEEASIYYNYVMQAHARLPQEKLKFARVGNVIYDEDNKVLNVFIKHTKNVSNIAVMVEDGKATNFTNPRYEINNNESIATFDVSFNGTHNTLSDLAISVSLNDENFFRSIETISSDNATEQFNNFSLFDFFVLGLIISFSPGIFYVMLKLIYLLRVKKERVKIYVRFIFSLLISLIIFIKILNNSTDNSYTYFVISALLIEASLLFSVLGYMDFSLFRPFRKLLKHGYVLGFFSTLLFIGFPLIGKKFIYSISNIENANIWALSLFFFVLGVILFATLFLILYSKNRYIKIEFRAINAFYGVLYLFIRLYYLWSIKGIYVLFITIIMLMLSFIVWYYYPIILAKFIKGKTLSKANIGLFNKIQLFTFGILLVVYIASIICINFTPSKKVINPSIDETLIVINDQINKNRAVLVAVDSNWNFNSLINKIILKKLERKGLTIAYINNYLPTKEGKYWIEKYNKSHSNLYILFSNRHQNGLILPKKLYEVNFNYSVKDFN